MVQMVREGSETGYLSNSRDFMGEFGVSRRTVARDLDHMLPHERAPTELIVDSGPLVAFQYASIRR
jgi:hypothetical protein